MGLADFPFDRQLVCLYFCHRRAAAALSATLVRFPSHNGCPRHPASAKDLEG